MQAHVKTGFADDVKHSFADDARHVEFSVLLRRQFRVGIFYVAAHFAVRDRFGGNASDRAARFNFHGQTVKVLQTRTEQ